MRVACSTTVRYKQDVESALQKIRDMGFDAVDLLTIDGWAHIDPAELADRGEAWFRRLDELFARFQLYPVALNIGTRSQLFDRSPQAVEERLREIRAAIGLMKRFSIPVAVIQPRGKDLSRPYSEVMLDCASTLKEILGIAAEEGVRLALELHIDSPFETPEQAEELIARIPDLRLVYDPSHLVMQGIDIRETGGLMDRSIHVHLRDAAPGKMQVRLGEGNVDMDWVLSELKRRNYAGSISIEYLESDEYDVEEDVLRLRSVIRQHFPDIKS